MRLKIPGCAGLLRGMLGVQGAGMGCAGDEGLARRYEEDGFVAVGAVLEPPLLAALGARIDAIADGAIDAPDGSVRFHADLAWGPGTGIARRDAVWQILDAHRWDAVVAEVAALPRLTRLAAALLGGAAQAATSQVITKPARHGAPVPWHQDASYWGQRLVATCWLAIDDATPGNGCLRLIPGSHRAGQRAYTARRHAAVGLELLEADAVPVERQVLSIVAAGCATFHSPWTLHASEANASPMRRRAIAITYGLAAAG